MRKSVISTLLVALLGNVNASEFVLDANSGGELATVNFSSSTPDRPVRTGTLEVISGQFTWRAGDIDTSTFTLELDPASVDRNLLAPVAAVGNPFNTEMIPSLNAGFVSTAITDLGEWRLLVSGVLTLHGVSRPLSFEATRSGTGETLFGTYRAGIQAVTSFDLYDYGLAEGPGTQLTLSLALEDLRQ